jgi:transposase
VAFKGRRATFAERVSVCEAIEGGQSPSLVAEISGFSRSSVFAWWRTYREDGPEALRTRETPGPAARLSEQQMVDLYLELTREGRRGSSLLKLWTREMVADLIEREFEIGVSLVTATRVLERLGVSPQPLLRRAYERDPKKTQAWRDTAFPQIQAKAKTLGAAIFFVDETSIRSDYATGSRRQVWMTSAIRPRGEACFTLQQGEISAEGFVASCKSFMSYVDRPIFLIVASSDIHRTRVVNRFAVDHRRRLALLFLPRYWPELNPVYA